MAEFKGIDVSTYQGDIDWEKVKPNINFAILRCGLGDDIKSQDDNKFERNYAECKRLGIPVTVYFFSYAVNKDKVKSEIAHIKRLLTGKTLDGPVYIDVENTRGLDWRSISDATMLDIMKEFNTQLNALGFKMGIYSSRSAFWNEKMTDKWYDGISKWVAEYAAKVNKFDRPYDIWQNSSKGSIPGISGNVDTNIMYNEVIKIATPTVKPTKKTNEEIAKEVMQGKWGNGEDRKKRLIAEGYDYNAVQSIVNDLAAHKPVLKSNEEIAKEVMAGKWGNGNDRKARLEAAGYNYNAVQEIVNKLANPVKPSAPKYTVYTVRCGDTLSGIASRFGTNYRKIAADNGINNPNKIYVGQQLKIYK